MDFDLSAYHCAICLLRQNPLKTLSSFTVEAIIRQGRPTPELPTLSKECRYKGKIFTRRFKKENYLRYRWMAGCGIENKLFCWPCYMFSTDPTDTWGFKGFDGLSNFSNSVKTHINQEAHFLNVEKYNSCAPEKCKISFEISFKGQSPNSSFAMNTKRRVSKTKPIEMKTIIDDDEDYNESFHHPDVIMEDLEDEYFREAELSSRDVSDVSQSAGVNSADKYQLKWHSHQQNLNSSISCLYRNDRYADVTLITCNNEESFAIPAHKLVLGSSSTYFANIFDKTVAPLNAMTYIVLPSELTKRSMQTLIQYMYTGESTVSVDILNEVLRGGEILKIRGLWRNQSGTDGAPEQPSGKENEQHHSRHRTERISIDRVPLQEPQRSTQGSVVVHDSPVIVTNPAKTYNVSHASTSSSNPMINVKRDVAVDPGDRSKSVPEGSTNKRSHTAMNQENSIQGARQHIPAKITSPRAALANAENLPNSRNTGTQKMPEALNFLNVKEEPVEWTDVPPEEINIDKASFPTVKVELRETTNLAHESGGESTSQEQVYSPLTCELCSETFTIPAEWVRHIESHSDPPHTVSKRRRRVDDDDEADVTAALKCDLCAMYFVTPAEWVRHVQSTHTETELAMSNNSSLRRQSSKTYTSDAQSSLVTQLVAHQQQQQQQQEKTCSVCNKSFPSYASMLIHKRTHTGERPFYCEICNKGFNVKSNLLRHMRTLHNQQGGTSPSQGGSDSPGSE
ncbi:myoneurin isoform X3 [Uranotaenia lowii]|nr:myoneurin isoform X3 [Uranotaenia lowii]